jgi:hypothetical protein
MSTSWNDFKKHVDLLIEKNGGTGDEEIDFIDVSDPEIEVVGEEGIYYKCVGVGVGSNGVTIS